MYPYIYIKYITNQAQKEREHIYVQTSAQYTIYTI